MAEVVPFEDPADYRRAHRRIKKCWETGDVEFWDHAQKRMREDRLDSNDVQHVVRYGRIVDHSHPNAAWRYVLEGRAVDGSKVKVVVEVNGMLAIVTVVNPKRRKS